MMQKKNDKIQIILEFRIEKFVKKNTKKSWEIKKNDTKAIEYYIRVYGQVAQLVWHYFWLSKSFVNRFQWNNCDSFIKHP